MEGEKNCKMTSVKEKIDLLKKEKSRKILERLTNCKATTVGKDGIQIYLEFKNRGGRWYKPLYLYVYVIWTVMFHLLHIHFFGLVNSFHLLHFIFAAESILAGYPMRSMSKN